MHFLHHMLCIVKFGGFHILVKADTLHNVILGSILICHTAQKQLIIAKAFD